MGIYAYLYVDGKEIFSWRNELDYTILRLFSKENLINVKGVEAHKLVEQQKLNAYEGYDDDDDFSIVLYSATAGVLQDRLKALGVSEKTLVSLLETAENWYSMTLTKNSDPRMQKYYETQASTYNSLLKHFTEGSVLSSEESAMFDDILSYNPSFALYDHIKNAPRDKTVLLDISELQEGEAPDETLLEFNRTAEEIQRFESPPIILTEGVFDRKVLKESIGLLYPHLMSYIRFLDTDHKTEGGAGSVVKMLKSFAAAGISNRILAIFDNDTAAYDALSNFRKSSLPLNYRVMHYPDINLGDIYPTIGPQGYVDMNVNGLAGSIELYLGRDVLTDEAGKLRPVQWTGYVSKLKKYQGELSDKSKIQTLFLEKLKLAKADPSIMSSQDWDGIKKIVDVMLLQLADL